jgi:hypothetical protein
MNTGGQLPYQLRPNKAVERLIFLELLNRLDAVLKIGPSYDYVGFGGPQMEDFRLLHQVFPDMKMLSIEREPNVLKRQRFNCPHTNARSKLQTSADFVSAVSDRRKLIVWLDYTEPGERVIQIAEFQSLLRSLRERSIVKLTLNAAPATLGGSAGEPGLLKKRLEAFLSDFSRCFPNGLEEEAMAEENFPNALLAVIDYVAREAFSARGDWRFQPLTFAAYADSRQQMLTVTGIVGQRTDLNGVLTASGFADWYFSRLTWTDPVVRIRVPELTLKERVFINQLLPKLAGDAASVQKRLGFLLDDTQSESEEKLRNYIIFQRHYPYWGKVAI